MRVSNFDTSNSSPENFQRYSSKQMQDVVNILNKGIIFSDNFDGTITNVAFNSANTNTVITHNLERIPSGYLALELSAAMIIYTGSDVSNESQITLKSSAVGTAKILIF